MNVQVCNECAMFIYEYLIDFREKHRISFESCLHQCFSSVMWDTSLEAYAQSSMNMVFSSDVLIFFQGCGSVAMIGCICADLKYCILHDKVKKESLYFSYFNCCCSGNTINTTKTHISPIMLYAIF